MPHLERHQRDLQEYKTNVRQSADARFGAAWWGAWEQHVHPPVDATIVDLGVGSGHLLGKLRSRLPRAKLVGIDLHPEMLALARDHLSNADVELIEADLAGPIPIEEASVDVVVSALTFHELPYPPDLLVNAARVLRPGGHFVLFDIVKWPLAQYLEGKELTRDTLDHYREHCLFTAEDLAWLVRRAGFDVQEVIGRSAGRFAQIFAVRGG